MKPAPHVRVDGSVGPPIGTLEEQLARAYAPRPTSFPYSWRERFVVTWDNCRQWRTDITRRIIREMQRMEDGR